MSKIVKLPPKFDEPPPQLVEKDYRECQHVRFEVHKEQPLVFCRDCDAPLDPIFVLRRIASEYASRSWRVDEMKREAERLEKQARRQQDGRRKPHLAESDARRIQRLQDIQHLPPSAFAGDISLTDKGG